MTDYWVSKLFFDLQQDGKLASEFRTNMAAVIARLTQGDARLLRIAEQFHTRHDVEWSLPR